jgi:DNA polymerase-3 subunit alpha
MSKKKKNIILGYETKFVSQSIKNGYPKENALKVYNLILKFANYGFNKAHSVSYSMIAYQMAYLKVYYKEYFLANLLNMSIGSEIKTKEYLDEAKQNDLTILKPNINESDNTYKIIGTKILLPLLIVKGLGENIANEIINDRNQNGEYKNYLDFISRTYKLGVNKGILESLISAGALDNFNLNRKTMKDNLPVAINYASLTLDSIDGLSMEPEIVYLPEETEEELRTNEYNALGFYLTNHPASKYTSGVVKSKQIPKYFDKTIKIVGLIENIHSIKTKKSEDMAFITLSDEFGNIDLTIFPKSYHLLSDLNKGNLIEVLGKVTKRYASYSVSVIKISKVS